MDFEIKDGVLVKYTGNTPDVIIPSDVTAIGEEAFKDNKFLKSVIITGNVTSIGNCAFYGCQNLEEIVISESVTTIGNLAFYGCNSLEKVVITKSVTTIGVMAFADCDRLEKIVIQESVTEIGADAFEDTKWLEDKKATEKNVVVVNGIAIASADNIEESVNLEEIKEIKQDTFKDCGQVKKFVVSDGIKIGYNAFLTGNDFNICLKHDDFYVNIPIKQSEIITSEWPSKWFNLRTGILFDFIEAGIEERELLFDELEIPEYRYPIAVFMAIAYDSEFFKAFVDVHFENIKEYAKNNAPDLLKFISSKY